MLQVIEWGRPAGFWLLLLPVLLLLMARFFRRPVTRVTGTLAIWKSVAEQGETRGERRSLRLPAALWLLLLGLTAGALSLAEPRASQAATPRAVVCVLDSSPSMFLPAMFSPATFPSDGGTTRFASALTEVARWLDEHEVENERRTWKRFVHGRVETFVGSAPPEMWSRAPAAAQPEPRWHELDEAGVLWVTDAMPVEPASRAAEYASGGEAVPGPVAVSGSVRHDWDGATVLAIEDGASRGRIRLVESGEEPLCEVLGEFLGLWARERGLVYDSASEGDSGGASDSIDVRLEVRVPAGESREVALARDGWSLRGAAVPLAASTSPGEAWLGEGQDAFVRSQPGLVECGLTSCESSGGDSPAFAVSWSELFDGALLPAPGVVSLAERQDAGESGWRFPSGGGGSSLAMDSEDLRLFFEGAAPGEEIAPASSPFAAWLASLAFALVLASLLARALGHRLRN